MATATVLLLGSGPLFQPFLRLPREIRNIIYLQVVHELVLAIDKPIRNANETAILRCSRLIREEATPVFYQLAHFRISRQDFYDLILASISTTSRLSKVQDLAKIRNLTVTNFEINKILHDTFPFPYTALLGLRKVLVELEICSCGPAHYSIRRLSCAQVAGGLGAGAPHIFQPGGPLHYEKSYAAKTVLRNLDKLREQVQWMQNVKGYEVVIKVVMMENKGKMSEFKDIPLWDGETPEKKWKRDQVAVLMITREKVEFVEGDETIAVEGRKSLIEHLELCDKSINGSSSQSID